MCTVSKTGVREEGIHTPCLVVVTQEMISHGNRTILRWIAQNRAVALL